MPSKSDLEEFKLFCQSATITQLRNILDKEETARRAAYAAIARQELENRK